MLLLMFMILICKYFISLIERYRGIVSGGINEYLLTLKYLFSTYSTSLKAFALLSKIDLLSEQLIVL